MPSTPRGSFNEVRPSGRIATRAAEPRTARVLGLQRSPTIRSDSHPTLRWKNATCSGLQRSPTIRSDSHSVPGETGRARLISLQRSPTIRSDSHGAVTERWAIRFKLQRSPTIRSDSHRRPPRTAWPSKSFNEVRPSGRIATPFSRPALRSRRCFNEVRPSGRIATLAAWSARWVPCRLQRSPTIRSDSHVRG